MYHFARSPVLEGEKFGLRALRVPHGRGGVLDIVGLLRDPKE